MWTCPNCESKVDDSFDICWSCGTTPEGVEDPEFVTADESEPIEDPVVDDNSEFDESLEDFAGTPLPDLVDCYMAGSTIEAKFIADRLMEEGIPAIADRQDINMTMGGYRPSMWGYGPKVRIRPKDLPRARQWLADYEERRRSRS
jgi:hypothetical protein